MVEYNTYAWLEKVWRSDDLVRLTDFRIKDMWALVERVCKENEQLYKSALEQQDRDRVEFRQLHPRSKLPNALDKRPTKPPDLVARWEKLLKRRQKLLAEIQQAQEKAVKRQQEKARREARKQVSFRQRMVKGRFDAMQRRETAIRHLIDRVAAKHGVELTKRPIDARLEQLFTELEELW